jgi:hypothetical protein
MKMTDKIRRLLTKGKTAKEIATQLKIEPNRVYTVKWLDAKKVTPERSSDPDVRKAEKKYIKKISAAYKAKKPSKIIKAMQEMKAILNELDKIKDKPLKRDLKAEAWAKKNPWFGEDKELTAQALGYHEVLVESGVDPKSDEYWKKVDAEFNPDLVNHPPHYKSGGIETIDFIEAKDLNYRLGNVVKYVSRAGRKDSDPVQDLEKAAWYLQREINARKNA